MKDVFGIDLGTTNTVISKGTVLFNGLIQSQIIQVMQFDENKCPTMEFILPSILYVDENGKEYVGKIAKDIKSKFAVWGGTVTANNPIIVKAKSCDDALIIARNLNASGLNTVKRL